MDDTSLHGTPEGGASAGHETTDVSITAISKWGIGLALAVAAVMTLMWYLFDVYAGMEARAHQRPASIAAENPQTRPPEPRLQAQPRVEMSEFLAEEQRLLTAYEWIDPDKGVVRIPVDRALELVAKEGLPKTPENWLKLQAQMQQQAQADQSKGSTK